MSDKLSDLERKRKQLQELKQRKANLLKAKAEKEAESPTKPISNNYYDTPNYESSDKKPYNPGLNLSANIKPIQVNKVDVNDHQNIVKILNREKPICYDQKVEVTVEKQRQWAEMEAQEKAPAYDFGTDQNQDGEEKDIDAEVKKLEEELKVNYLSNEEVLKLMDNNKFKRFMKESYTKFEDVISDKVPLIEDIMEHE